MSVTKVTIAGKIDCPHFQRAQLIGNALALKHPDLVSVTVMQFFETQWDQYLKQTANKFKGVFYEHSLSPLVYTGDCDYIGNGDDFVTWALHNHSYHDDFTAMHFQKLAAEAIKDKINRSKTRKYAELTFNVNGQDSAVIFELFHDICPRTVENFLGLCKGLKNKGGEEITYTGSEVHRVVPGMFMQAGRIRHELGGASLFEGEFEDESFAIKHTEAGMLGMCKRSDLKHTNESQFYVTLGAPLSFLDNNNVVFGRVVSGYATLCKIEALPTMNDRPNEVVKISQASAYSK